VAERVQGRQFPPRPASAWKDLARRYQDLEARYRDG